jgi:hypothetical protein
VAEGVREMSKSGIQAVRCSNCDYEFPHQPGEEIDAELEGEPCPSCGNTSKTHSVGTSAAIYWRVWSNRYKVLLDNAKKLRDQGNYEAAIVTAQTACEVCTESVLTGALHERFNDTDVVDLITTTLSTYNPKNARVKDWYEILFDHRIQDEPLWQPLMEHVTRRHRIVHRGEEATEQQADESIAAVDEFTRHLLENYPS